jgi:glyoxylase-like metal-dependent hydrolase (beta-lactamase superfamily II)
MGCTRRILVAAALAMAALGQPLAQGQGFSRVEIKTTELAPGLYMLSGAGGNMGLAVGDDAVFLIDDQFHISGEEVHAFHVPRAHTDGDLIVHFRKGDVVHMGDVFFNGNYPFIDLSSGGTPEGLVAAFDRVAALCTDKTRIIPGHGPLASRSDVGAHRDMLATAVQRIRDARRAGKSDDEIRKSAPLADLDATYGRGFIKPEVFAQTLLAGVPR